MFSGKEIHLKSPRRAAFTISTTLDCFGRLFTPILSYISKFPLLPFEGSTAMWVGPSRGAWRCPRPWGTSTSAPSSQQLWFRLHWLHEARDVKKRDNRRLNEKEHAKVCAEHEPQGTRLLVLGHDFHRSVLCSRGQPCAIFSLNFLQRELNTL